ncbi:DeoR/GlpR family DNA-binding transcription regulator [Treponema primitia]|uniref:DeoR/GlpR family DNA-binding transcription regulator n=1 Tax=Treponema primitia TaxID=88058 RepID=UPI0002555006|nr:DeoR/GlpR family DNA-binding transcription regulator [Treponema primitia]
MFPEQRREKILELLRENGSCRVQELKKIFQVSEPTIRQDLETMEHAGLIIRQHGGAFISNYSSFAADIQLERHINMDRKTLIGAKAAEFVNSGDSVILDSGTTVTEMINPLLTKKELKIVTPAINITLALGKEPTNTIVMPGGEFKAPTLSLTGEKSVSIFSDLYVEKLFLAAGGFSLEAGLTYPSFVDLPLKRAMINSAKTVYLLVDSSKLEKILFASLGCLDKIDFLITDAGISQDYVKRLADINIETVICGETGDI